MKALPTRIISALVALALFFAITYFFKSSGVIWAGFTLCIIGAFEYQKILFRHFQMPYLLRFWFLLVCSLLLFITVFSNWMLAASWGILISAYFAGTLWIMRSRTDNDGLLRAISLSALGFVYCAMLPSFALTILRLDNGHLWFLLLVTCVFSGDIFAYFGGSWFGREKLMPALSPNKTRAGAIAGLLGSVTASALVQHFSLQNTPMVVLIVAGALAGVLAQNGDLFESLIKRVADVKDSGRIMPGHGGVLDRLDGVYFAAPLIYAVAEYFQNTH